MLQMMMRPPTAQWLLGRGQEEEGGGEHLADLPYLFRGAQPSAR
jgi:hypothetical protein